ncbi:uncharacterized protein JCM15063_006003 [Sporobolomyces koalae]|uniref:uncharacterized protein n=1 Tax=Sporobolomyces koalae TaxID=500713 RepID=UPI00317646CF
MSTDKSLSQTVGDKTNGTIGEQTLTNEIGQLASHTLEFGKGLVNKDASSNQTLGSLVNEGRDLAGHVLHAVSDVISTGADKAKEAAGDAQESANKDKPVGYVAQARDLAASALQTAESYIATGQKKVQETTGDDVKNKAQDLSNQAQNAANDASNTAQKKADELKQ